MRKILQIISADRWSYRYMRFNRDGSEAGERTSPVVAFALCEDKEDEPDRGRWVEPIIARNGDAWTTGDDQNIEPISLYREEND